MVMAPCVRIYVVGGNQDLGFDQIIEERPRLRPANAAPIRCVSGRKGSSRCNPLGKGKLPRIIEYNFLRAMEKREKGRSIVLPGVLQQSSAGIGERELSCPIDAGNRRPNCFMQ